MVDRGDIPALRENAKKLKIEMCAASNFFLRQVVGAKNHCNRIPSDPMRRAFVRNGKAPSPSTRGILMRVTSVNNGTGPSDHNNPGSAWKRRFQSDLHIACNQSFSEKKVLQNAPEDRANFGRADPGCTYTRASYLSRGDSGCGASLRYGLMQ